MEFVPEPAPDAVGDAPGPAADEEDGKGAIGVADAALLPAADAAEVNGAWITDATELETACRVAATKFCFCSANAVVTAAVDAVATEGD